MKKNIFLKPRLVLISMIILILVMFGLPFFSVENYSIITNTTSHLGSQFSPNAWIMNITFMILGTTCIIESIKFLKTYWVHQFLLVTFGLGLIFTGVFRHAPIIVGQNYDVIHDTLHSIFASLVGFSFVLLCFSASFIEEKRKDAFINTLIGLLATLFSIMMATLPHYAGMIQRVMFIMSFTWLHLFLSKRSSIQ
jgi:hypothetical membrane protein